MLSSAAALLDGIFEQPPQIESVPPFLPYKEIARLSFPRASFPLALLSLVAV